MDFAGFAFFVAVEEGVGIGGEFGHEEVGGVKLAEELDGFALGGGVVAELFIGDVPCLADGAYAVEQADEAEGGFREAEEGVVGVVLDDVPGLAAEVLAADLYGAAELGVEFRDAVPGLMECRTFNSHLFYSDVSLLEL